MKFPDLNSILEQLELDPFAHGLQIIAAQELETDSFPRLDTDRPALVFHLRAARAQAVARTLQVNFPPSHPIRLLDGKRQVRTTLDTLPRTKVKGKIVLFLPPLPHPGSPLTLANIMARLRAPVGGCPWDLEQTHASITRALVEEAYEVIEAISEDDISHLMEELGDLWLHVLFQTQIARDQDEFMLSDVGAELAAKLIRRHPHVFGDEQAQDAGWVLQNWERIKQAEKQNRGQSTHADTLDVGIPRDLPALTRAQKVAERARRKKLAAPNGALAPIVAREIKTRRRAAREEALGKILLELAALAELHGIDAERALYIATKRFAQQRAADLAR